MTIVPTRPPPSRTLVGHTSRSEIPDPGMQEGTTVETISQQAARLRVLVRLKAPAPTAGS